MDAEEINSGSFILPRYKGTKDILTTSIPPELNGERGCYLEELTGIGAFAFAGDYSNRKGTYYVPISVQSTYALRNEPWLKPLLGKFVLNGGFFERHEDEKEGIVYRFYNNPSVFSVDRKSASLGMFMSAAAEDVSTIPELLQNLGVIDDSNKITSMHEMDNINEYGEQFAVLLTEMNGDDKLRVFFSPPTMYASSMYVVLERFSDSPLNFSHYPPHIQRA